MPTERVHGTVRAVQRGAVRPLGPKGVPSAIVKTPVSCPVAVGALGLAGDAQGDRLALVTRPNPGWTLARVQGLLYRDALDYPALSAFAKLEGLSASWRDLALRRLESGAVEDWMVRLRG